MHCPSCGEGIAEPAKHCMSCGYAYGADMAAKLALYFDLKKEAEQVKELVKGELWRRVKEVVTKVDRFGEMIEIGLAGRDFGQVAVETVSEEPSAKVAEEKKESAVAAQPSRLQSGLKISGHGAAPSVARKEPGQFEVKFGQKWLLIIGIVTMVFGVGYFLKYSFDQGWIGPAGRVSMAYLWGIAFLVAGNVFRKREYETFGLYLVGGGIATLYFSTFAAFQLYQLIPQVPSFLIMVMITVLAGVLSVLYDTKWLAILGIAGGFLTPVMLSTGHDNQLILMSYMTVLNLGLLGIAFYKRWELLNVTGFVFTYLLFYAWFNAHYRVDKFWPSIIFLNVFFLIYSILPFAYQFFRKTSEKMEGFLIVFPNSLFAFGFGYVMITQYASLEWVGILTVSYSALFLGMATWLAKAGREDQEAFVLLTAKSALFLVITIPVIFSKHWITIFWCVQAAVICWAGCRLQRRLVIGCGYLVVLLATGKFFAYDYETVFSGPWLDSLLMSGVYTHMVAERLLTSISVLGALFYVGRLARRQGLGMVSEVHKGDHTVFYLLFGISLFFVLNREVSLFFSDYLPAARFASISVLWTVFSVVLMMLGFRNKSSAIRKMSLGIFAVTLGKVFLFDMANVSTPYRIVSFIILGLVLVGTSYLYYKFKDRLLHVMSSEGN